MLQATRASFSVGRKAIVRPTNLVLLPGQMTVMIGPNGAGKSTLFKMLTGELAPTSGLIELDNRPLTFFSAAELARRRAVVPQASQLSFPFTVCEVVLLGANVPGLSIASVKQEWQAQNALDRVGLAEFSDHLYLNLSGGERQRVHLARALCQIELAHRAGEATPILMLDEPTSSLDLRHQIKVLKEVRERADRGWLTLVVLHDLNLAASFADVLVVMSDGQIAASGSVEDVFCDELLSDVYRCPVRTNNVPASDQAFVLPHYTIQKC